MGLIAISPYDQQPKVRIYRDELGECKGDGAICFNSEASVKMAIDILDGGYIRPSCQISVKLAEFQVKNGSDNSQNQNFASGDTTVEGNG